MFNIRAKNYISKKNDEIHLSRNMEFGPRSQKKENSKNFAITESVLALRFQRALNHYQGINLIQDMSNITFSRLGPLMCIVEAKKILFRVHVYKLSMHSPIWSNPYKSQFSKNRPETYVFWRQIV